MRFAEWRKEAGLTQQAVADSLGCTQGAVSGLERFEFDPTLDLALKIQLLSGGKVMPGELVLASEAAE